MVSKKDKELELEKLMAKLDDLGEKCDTMPQCAEQKGCPSCKVKADMDALEVKIEEVENEIFGVSGTEDDVE